MNIIVRYIIVFIAAFSAYKPYGQCIDLPLVTVMGEAKIDVIPNDIVVQVTTTRIINLADMILVKDNILLQMRFVEKENWNIVEVSDMITREDKAYMYTKEFIITVHDFKSYYDLTQKLLRSGFYNFKIIDLRVSNLAELKEKARLQAIKNAQQKAISLSAELGQSIGRAYRIEEIEASFNTTYKSDFTKDIELVRLNDSYPQSPGFISVIAKLKVSFELK